jgi:hypothetical protein
MGVSTCRAVEFSCLPVHGHGATIDHTSAAWCASEDVVAGVEDNLEVVPLSSIGAHGYAVERRWCPLRRHGRKNTTKFNELSGVETSQTNTRGFS